MLPCLANFPIEILANITSRLSAFDILGPLSQCGCPLLAAKLRAGGVVSIVLDLKRLTKRACDLLESFSGLRSIEFLHSALDRAAVQLIPRLTPKLEHILLGGWFEWTGLLTYGSMESIEIDPELFPLVNPSHLCWNVAKSFPGLKTLVLPHRYGNSIPFELQRLGPDFLIRFLCGLPASLTNLDFPLLADSMPNLCAYLPPHLETFSSDSLQDLGVLPSLPRSTQQSLECLYLTLNTRESPSDFASNMSLLPNLTQCELSCEQAVTLEMLQYLPRNLTSLQLHCNTMNANPADVLQYLPDTLAILSLTYEIAENYSGSPRETERISYREKPHLHSIFWRITGGLGIRTSKPDQVAKNFFSMVPNLKELNFCSEHIGDLLPSYFATMPSLLKLTASWDESCFKKEADGVYPLHRYFPKLTFLDVTNFRNGSDSFDPFPPSLTKATLQGTLRSRMLYSRPPSLTEIWADLFMVDDENTFLPASEAPSATSSASEQSKGTPSAAPHSNTLASLDFEKLQLDHLPRLTTSPDDAIKLEFTFMTTNFVCPPIYPATLTRLALLRTVGDALLHVTPSALPLLSILELDFALPKSLDLEPFEHLHTVKVADFALGQCGRFPQSLRHLVLKALNVPHSFRVLPHSLETLHSPYPFPVLPPSITSIQIPSRGAVKPLCFKWAKELPLLKEILLRNGDTLEVMDVNEIYAAFGTRQISLVGGTSEVFRGAPLIPARLGGAPIELDIGMDLEDWLSRNLKKAYPLWKPIRAAKPRLESLQWGLLLPQLSSSLTELDLWYNADTPMPHDFAVLLPRGLVKLAVGSILPPQVNATHGLPTGLKTLKIDTYGFGKPAFLGFPQAITHLSLWSQKTWSVKYAKGLPQKLVKLELSAFNIPKEAFQAMPDSIVALTLMRRPLNYEILQAIPPHVKVLEAPLPDTLSASMLLETVKARGMAWLGAIEVPDFWSEVAPSDSVVAKLRVHQTH